MKAEDSRAIARDMQEKPYTDLSIEDRIKIMDMCLSRKIITFEQYIFQRDGLYKKQKDEKDSSYFR